MTTTAVEQLLYLFDDAFEGKDWHSLLSNLRALTPADWEWVAPGGRRSIRDIVQHVASCKVMYHNQAFGDGQLKWDDPRVDASERTITTASAVDWLREGHARLRESLAALSDEDLLALRGHHSGKLREARWVFTIMLQHDLYHAGEINYIRALHQGNDE